LEKLKSLEEEGPKIGKAMKELDALPGKDEYIQKALQNAGENIVKELHLNKVGEEAKQSTRALSPILKQIDAISEKPELSFQDLQDAKKFIAGQTNFDNNFANDLKKRAYGIFKSAQMEQEDAAAKELGKPEIAQALAESRAAYSVRQLFDKAILKDGTKETLKTPLSEVGGFHATRHGLVGLVAHTLIGGHFAAPVAMGLSLAQQAIKKFGKQSTLSKAIQVFEDSPVTAIAKATQQQNHKILQGVKSVFAHTASPAKAGAVRGIVKIAHAISQFSPNNGSGMSEKQQLAFLQRSVTNHNNDPTALAEHLGNLTAPLRKAGLEPVAAAYTDHQVRLMKVLQSILPPGSDLSQAHPFAAKVNIDEISPAVKEKYQRALTVASEPETLLEMIKNNTITPYDVAVCAAVNPATLQQMRNALVEEAMKTKPNLTYQHQLSFEIMMGENIDQSAEQLPVLQMVFPVTLPMSGEVMGGSGSKGKLSGGSAKSISSNYLTGSQKVSQGI
jgi:hypothetical protein